MRIDLMKMTHTMMHYTDDEREEVDSAQAEQNAVLADLMGRRRDLVALGHIHHVAHAYNYAVYGVAGFDIDATPHVVTPRQWRVTLQMASTFIAARGEMIPAQVRHAWAIHMAQEGSLLPGVLTPFEDLDLQSQLMEQAGTEAMLRAMTPPVIIEDYTPIDHGTLIYQAARDNPDAITELERRRSANSA